MSATFELVRDLIRLASVTPNDGGCQPLIEQRLAPLGFKAEVLERNGTRNVWLKRGTARPLFVFAGHTDVVPAGPLESWRSDPFSPTVRDGMLYGRGAADMKSSIAAFVVAVEEFIAAHPTQIGAIALLLTSDEEGPATDGTVAVIERLKSRGERPDFALIGEPTSVTHLGDTVKNGRRGSLSGKLVVHGVQGHVAYPQLARNPIHEVAPALAELIATVWDDGNEHFPPTTFQISNVHAGTGVSNVIPGQCVVDFNLRFASVSTAEGLCQRLEAILKRHGVKATMTWTVGAQPFLTAKGRLIDALCDSIAATTGQTAMISTTGGTSDGRFIATYCDQVVEFGPPNGTIHKIDECIRVSDLEPLKDIYRQTLERLLLPN